MKDLLKMIFSRVPAFKKTFAAMLAMIVLFGIVGSAYAWSPERPTYTVEHPADHVTFNSITNNASEGDERAFFEVKDAANTQSDGFSHTMNDLKDGQELLVRAFVHNNAASNLNGANFTGVGVAKNTKVRMFLPTATDTALRANAYISADNAAPQVVADSLDLNSTSAFNVSYVPGSAIQYTNAVPSGLKLSDSIVTTGAPIGYSKADGVVPGCFQYSSIVTIKVKVHVSTPGLTVTKQVAHPGDAWTKSVAANPSDTLSYMVTVKNTGNSTLNHVSVRDQLPAHVHLVPGSTTITNGNFPNGVSAGNDNVVSNGIDIGTYDAGRTAYVKYKVTVDPVTDIPCGANALVNTATAFQPGNNTTVSDKATVNVSKECQPNTPVTPGELPNTGAGDVIGIFAATTIAGALVHRFILSRRYS